MLGLISVPLERPEKYGERLNFTVEEMAEQRKQVEARNKGIQILQSAGYVVINLTYPVTVDDPVTETRSWTARFPRKRNDSYQFFECACHEDNEAICNYITSSRARR